MRFRRCRTLFVEPVERPSFNLQELLAGGTGVQLQPVLQVRAAHLPSVQVIDAESCAWLLACSAEQWQPLPEAADARGRVLSLLQQGLLVSDDPAHAKACAAEQRLRDSHWWPLSAVHYQQSCWDEVDSVQDMEQHQLVTARDLVRSYGSPPPEAPPRIHGAQALPCYEDDPMQSQLQARATCRNFDSARALPLPLLARVLQQVLMAQAEVETDPGVRFLKKNVPSAGSLHPLEAYLLVRNVEGMAPGLYHYHAVAHELGRLPAQPQDLESLCQRLLAGQHWFADAHVLLVLVCRFERNFWKYRNHAKAYRAVTLDAGHVSQALYASATALGLGAFVTAAINESEAGRALGLQPMAEGALAICGLGWRSGTKITAELDPDGHVWPRADPRAGNADAAGP
ncbi:MULTISPECIES: putative peptide maturation dehydrogenase [Stenotrophomonas]|uniref:putative peptide maturation dehydrogenase n=1 Tax=Stenotrophomonas TaxID=40323 RepID=UPI001311BCA3|nr:MULTISPECIES: putative peptide maturation dehydrogenase [Stenotrophomonas]MBN5161134.1 putative peptide maturation dehydrogenase [Stenotrophomonas maltophilia]MDG9844126.1 putative peptide maturation dehydrogenase [Stenotrophomonas sp. GD04054]MDH0015822.1 putative peptide maturation dehydrogenase [Stenotrophomonas sp. GD04028]MDH0576115.1 putative peptide maturation dehydrogenase [Stenotrophomonas sp. GD03997]MDH0861014.1 putative peptide maturation dehydrogenase [Stenotrophomonas sp. GD03